MTLVYIVLATLAGGLLSVVIAASLTLAVLSRVVKGLVSLSAGVLLGTALLHVLPEAFEGHDPQAGRSGLSVLVGDSIHNFCDGVIIAAAFLVDTGLGVVTALAIVAHEIPQEAGDFIVLLNAGFSRRKALLYNALSGLAAVAGGVLGYFLVGSWEAALPYLLVVASSSFIYVAVADLLPQLQQRLSWRETLAQVAWIGGGLGLVLLARALMHAHAH